MWERARRWTRLTSSWEQPSWRCNLLQLPKCVAGSLLYIHIDWFDIRDALSKVANFVTLSQPLCLTNSSSNFNDKYLQVWPVTRAGKIELLVPTEDCQFPPPPPSPPPPHHHHYLHPCHHHACSHRRPTVSNFSLCFTVFPCLLLFNIHQTKGYPWKSLKLFNTDFNFKKTFVLHLISFSLQWLGLASWPWGSCMEAFSSMRFGKQPDSQILRYLQRSGYSPTPAT